MTKEAILARLATLEKEKEDAQNLWRTLDGAVQECHHWLNELTPRATGDATETLEDRT